MSWTKQATTSSGVVSITESNFPFFKDYSINLFNTEKMSVDSGLNSTGALNTYVGGGVTDFFPVVAGDILYYNADVWQIAGYNSTKTFVSNLVGSTTTPTTIPNNGIAFVRVFSVTPSTTMITKNKTMFNTYMRSPLRLMDAKYTGDKLAGKIWHSEGDSITYGLHAEKTGTDRWPYARIIADRRGMILNNGGTSGATMGQIAGAGRTDSAVQRYMNYRPDADIITIAMSTNDTEGLVPLGTSSDTAITTFYGALNTLVPGLINQYPNAKIAFFTPLPRTPFTDFTGRVTAIKNVCYKYSVPVLDLTTNSGLCPDVQVINTQYFGVPGSYPTGDGLHPNYQGHLKISDMIEKFLESL
jgi:lysophospholipase L1-like esterase